MCSIKKLKIFFLVMMLALVFTSCGADTSQSVEEADETSTVETEYDGVANICHYDLFETQKDVYVSRWYMPLFIYHKSTGKLEKIEGLGYSDIYYEDGYIYGITMSNGGIGNICRYNIASKKEEVLADGLYGGYTILDNKIYYFEGQDVDNTYMMNLDGSNKEASDKEVIEPKRDESIPQTEDYELFCNNTDVQTSDYYLKTPKGNVFLGRYGC